MKRKILCTLLCLLIACVIFPLHGSAEKVSSEDVDWGLVLEAEDVTPTGMVVVVHQYGSNHTGYFGYGSYYHLEIWQNNRWERVPSIDDDMAWTMEIYIFPGNCTYRWEKNWKNIYGTLTPGRYRFVKEFSEMYGSGSSVDADFYAEFIISNPHICQVNNSSKTCTICGKLDPNFTGLRKLGNHWFYYKSGKVATDVTSLVKYNGEWWYVVDGKVASETTTLVKWGGEWWYIVKGKVASKTTTLVKWGGEWWYVIKGKVASKTTSLVKYGGEWWYVVNGKVASYFTGLVEYNGESWYVVKGKVASKTTDMVLYNGEWSYIVKGKVASKTTTLVKSGNGWWYVINGKFTHAPTALIKYNNAWWYVDDGMLHTDTTGLIQCNNEWCYVVKGKVATGITGLVKYHNIWYYLVKGKLDVNTTGLISHYGQRYYVKNGIVMSGNDGKITLDGKTYYLKQGVLTNCHTAGHRWTAATCSRPETCSACNITRGSLVPHTWTQKSCGTFCSVCNKVQGTTTSHRYRNHVCTICGCREFGYGTWTAYLTPGEVLRVFSAKFEDDGDLHISFYGCRELDTIDISHLDTRFDDGSYAKVISYQGKSYITLQNAGHSCDYTVNGDTITTYFVTYFHEPDCDHNGCEHYLATFRRSAANQLTVTNSAIYNWMGITENLVFTYQA